MCPTAVQCHPPTPLRMCACRRVDARVMCHRTRVKGRGRIYDSSGRLILAAGSIAKTMTGKWGHGPTGCVEVGMGCVHLLGLHVRVGMEQVGHQKWKTDRRECGAGPQCGIVWFEETYASEEVGAVGTVVGVAT